MNYDNVYKLYFKTSQILLDYDQMKYGSSSSFFSELHTCLTHLRQSLSCYVCYQLLTEPHSAKDSDCQHYLCQKCIGGKLRLPAGGRSSCSFCKNTDCFVPDEQLKLLLDCYGSLCTCILSISPLSPVHKQKNGQVGKNLRGILDICRAAALHTGKIQSVQEVESGKNADQSKKPAANREISHETGRRTAEKEVVLKRTLRSPKKLTGTQMAAKRLIRSHVERGHKKQQVTPGPE